MGRAEPMPIDRLLFTVTTTLATHIYEGYQDNWDFALRSSLWRRVSAAPGDAQLWHLAVADQRFGSSS